MSVKIDRQCTRCHRDDSVPVDDIAAAMQMEKDIVAQREAIATLRACVEKIPVAHRPALFVVMGDVVLSHEHLCLGTDTKRSCARRITDLVACVDEHDERKPRTKKTKPE